MLQDNASTFLAVYEHQIIAYLAHHLYNVVRNIEPIRACESIGSKNLTKPNIGGLLPVGKSWYREGYRLLVNVGIGPIAWGAGRELLGPIRAGAQLKDMSLKAR